MSIRFVKPEHVDILRDYLDNNCIVLIYPEQQEKARELGVEDGDDFSDHQGYDFGGDSDVIIDRVASDDHYFFMQLAENKEEEST
jgi:hypothetical protein